MMLTNALYALVQLAKMWTPICPKKANLHHETLKRTPHAPTAAEPIQILRLTMR